jgi:sulfur relay (sulfurtransferase) complex TusBCD TusD component (DsrE family)
MWQVFLRQEGVAAGHSEPMVYSDALAMYEAWVRLYPEAHVVIRKAIE